MYWNNCWLNNFNRKLFFNKILFLEELFNYLLLEKSFSFFFKKVQQTNKLKNMYFKTTLQQKLLNKNFFKKKNKSNQNIYIKKKKKIIKYNFTRIWFIKYNNYILLTTFFFFYFKIKKIKLKKNQTPLLKTLGVFWKKKRNSNFKKHTFNNIYVNVF